jgi:hypothetical protein
MNTALENAAEDTHDPSSADPALLFAVTGQRITDNNQEMADGHYLVSHGKSGGLGHFTARLPQALRRGDRVIIDSPRGREVGTVLCPANVRQSRILGHAPSGAIVRPLTPADDTALAQLRETEQRLFEAGRLLAREQGLPVEVLDVDVLFEDRAILQLIGVDETPLDTFVGALRQAFHLDIHLENLAVAREPAEPEDHGCGKPDCGKTAGGGCSTCGTGGGCSSCGTGGTDLRPYFAHLRTQMEAKKRTSLL